MTIILPTPADDAAPGTDVRRPAPLLTRRAFTRTLGTGALVLAGTAFLATTPASAGISWCRTDPLISVNGKTGHCYVESTEAMFAAATGPIEIEVLVPEGTLDSAWADPLDNGFGQGYRIRFREDGRLSIKGGHVYVRIRAKAPCSDHSLPVRVIFHADANTAMDSTKTGSGNSWIETGTVKL